MWDWYFLQFFKSAWPILVGNCLWFSWATWCEGGTGIILGCMGWCRVLKLSDVLWSVHWNALRALCCSDRALKAEPAQRWTQTAYQRCFHKRLVSVEHWTNIWNYSWKYETSSQSGTSTSTYESVIKGLSRSSSCPSRITTQLKALSCYPKNKQVFENMLGWHIPQLTLLL